ncbi:MAG: Rab family GTPase [Candidatus Njordarchaeales archaeon]
MHNKEFRRYKVAVAGDAGSGKTSLIYRLIGHPDITLVEKTKGVYIETLTNKNIELIFWDFSGQKHFREAILPFFRGSHIVVLVFDLSNPQSLVNLVKEWSIYVKNALNDVPCIVIGNKKDIKTLPDDFIEASLEEMQKTINVREYLEVSAMTGEGLEKFLEVLYNIAEELRSKGI